MKHKPRSFIIPFFVMFFFTYGVVSVYQDWLSKPIRHACEYIGDMGLVFWICLLVGQTIGGQVQMGASLPKIACTECGVEFFMPDAMVELRKKAKGEVSSIVMPQPRVKLN